MIMPMLPNKDFFNKFIEVNFFVGCHDAVYTNPRLSILDSLYLAKYKESRILTA